MGSPARSRAVLIVALALVPALVAGVALRWEPAGLVAEAVSVGVVGMGVGPTEQIRYDRDIRPILSDRCFKCHGPDPAARRAELRLDVREVAVGDRKGGPAVTPGKPEASELWHRVSSSDPEEQMPPPGSNKRTLSADEKELVRRWIAEGAAYEPHWSFVAPARPVPPEVRDSGWCRNPVDRFVLARLENEKIAPSREADRQVALRRVFLDLTGLPPTVEEIDAFLADTGADAYERLVDRLLTEEPYRSRYAERMAVPWLDAARYADTNGIHMDAGRQMWAWRDWVLNAYRENMPFDRFLTEQLAGDLLPDATQAQKVASGFNRNHVATDEGGAIAEEYLVEYAVDRAATTGSVFLGMTLGCARCHEHKFDPVSQDEFYRFYAFFNSIEEPGLYSQLPDANRAFEPFMAVPTPEQEQALAEVTTKLAGAMAELDVSTPEEETQRAAFMGAVPGQTGVAWEGSRVEKAMSSGGATLAVQPDGSVLVSGASPDKDDHVITLRTEGTGLRLLSLEALTDPSLPHGRVGRFENGNAVLSGVEAEAVSVAEPSRRVPVRFGWAWADYEQDNGDFRVINALNADELGWAVGAHQREGGRVALFMADEPFGFEGGTDLIVTLQYRSMYKQHAFGRVRLGVGRVGDEGKGVLPAAVSGWYFVGPFPAESGKAAFDTAFGPENDPTIELTKNYGAGNQFWRFDPNFRDEQLNNFGQGVHATYVGRRIFSPTAREVEISLGSDDGFRLFLNGNEVASKQIDRALAMDQDKANLTLAPGINTLVLKIVNTGGPAGFYHRAIPREGELAGIMVGAVLPEAARFKELETRLTQTWKLTFSPNYRVRKEAIAGLEKRKAEAKAAIPLTMVMQELSKQRDTFVLMRGAYDKPDKNRPATRGVPAALGKLPEGAPESRLGLAKWLTAPENPLVARVAMNRLWEIFFANGIVRTSEDFGLQGEYPSHPGLIDWLAVEFRESGWDVRHMVRLIVTSATYRQSSRVRTDLYERDPENRLLAFYPRRRLAAEQIRDQALYVSGLLVEKLGGPSVKPYQPEGLWQEIAMPQSNTRIFTRGMGSDLWRRSLYTYWKRASPPPSMMAFDAPTREFCTIRRASTNTPLQALALWNDEQFFEAARVLAQRVMQEPGADREKLVRLFRRCTGRAPEDQELALLTKTLSGFRERYSASPEDAAKLLKVGEAPLTPDLDPAELAAWTMMSSAMMNLSATVTQG